MTSAQGDQVIALLQGLTLYVQDLGVVALALVAVAAATLVGVWIRVGMGAR